jgi:hypothetical protein
VTAFKLKRVQYMPKELDPGLLYVSEQYEVAGHLCACGCGNKVMTPLGATEWSFEDSSHGPTLTPSIGSWQLPCKSHYWIAGGEVRWAGQWTPEQIERGRRAEADRRRGYYETREHGTRNPVARAWRWLKRIFFSS